MFSRDHLVIGALGFVLGGVVTTVSITTILLTQQKEEKSCPPVVVAPQTVTQPEVAAPITEVLPTPVVPPEVVTPAPMPKTTPPPKIDTSKIKGIVGEEADKLSEDQKQLLARKQNLQSQLQDSDEIIRLKEQQIKDMEAKLNTNP